jgi:hypothetical protein
VATGRRTTKGGRTKVDHSTGISGDYSDVPEREGGDIYDGPAPTPGLYQGKLSSVGQHTTTEDSVVWTFDITEGKYAGWRGWVYTNSSAAKWKQQDILVALGLMEKGGSCSLSYEEILRKGGAVRLRVVAEPYNGETTAKIKTVLAPPEDADTDDSDDDDPDFQDEPETKPTRARGRKAKEPEPEPDEDDSDDELAELREELEGLTLVKLKQRAKTDYEATVTDLKGLDKNGVIEWIIAQEADPDDAGDDGDDADSGLDLDALEEELGGLDLDGLMEKAKEFGLWKTRTEKKKFAGMDEDKLVDAILDAAEEQNPEF